MQINKFSTTKAQIEKGELPKDLKNGSIVYAIDTEEYFLVRNEELIKILSNDAGEINLNLYDINRSIIKQLDPLDKQSIGEKIPDLIAFAQATLNNHYMLLCKDYNYYTIFENDTLMSFPDFASAICNIILELGDVFSIARTEDKAAMEIWIRPEDEEEPYAFYLFPYDAGVVYYG